MPFCIVTHPHQSMSWLTQSETDRWVSDASISAAELKPRGGIDIWWRNYDSLITSAAQYPSSRMKLRLISHFPIKVFLLNCSSWINKQLREKKSKGSLPPIFFHPLCYLIVWMLSRSTAITCVPSRWKLRKGWTLQTSSNMCTHMVLTWEHILLDAPCLPNKHNRTVGDYDVISSVVGTQWCKTWQGSFFCFFFTNMMWGKSSSGGSACVWGGGQHGVVPSSKGCEGDFCCHCGRNHFCCRFSLFSSTPLSLNALQSGTLYWRLLHYLQCNLASELHCRRSIIRLHVPSSGATKGCILFHFFTYAVLIPKTCKHTLMCAIGGVILYGFIGFING